MSWGTLLRRAWVGGIQDPEALAGLFKVSLQAMDKRLKHLQFIDEEPERSVSSYFRRQSEWFRTLHGTDDGLDDQPDSIELAA